MEFNRKPPGPSMKNDFEKLMEQASEHQYKRSCSVANWNFEPRCAGSFVISHNGESVAACENNQIIDAMWGSRVAGVEVYDILKYLIAHGPEIHLDVMTVRTDDCFALFGYEGPSRPIVTVPGLEDIDYYRAWVVSKTNTTDPEKMDHVVYWDQGNSWCEVLASFEGVTHEQFVTEIHKKYNEWIGGISMMNNVNKNIEFPYLSGCNDFDQITAHVSHEVMVEMEEAIRLYQETDKIIAEEDGGLAHINGEDFFVSAIEWYCGMMDTADFISEFGGDSSKNMKKLSFVDDVGYTEFEVSKDWYENHPDKNDVVHLFHAACADDMSHFNDLTGKYYEETNSLSTRLQCASTRAAKSHSVSAQPQTISYEKAKKLDREV